MDQTGRGVGGSQAMRSITRRKFNVKKGDEISGEEETEDRDVVVYRKIEEDERKRLLK